MFATVYALFIDPELLLFECLRQFMHYLLIQN